MYPLYYKIAGLKLALYSNVPLAHGENWGIFASEPFEDADYSYECFLRPTLPDGNGLQGYYDNVKKRFYAYTLETGNEMQIHLSQENLPWGSQVSQLYPQLALPHVLLRHKRLLLHASYVLTPDGAIIFTAPSGTGKTTQAELWRKHRDARIINGDRAVLSTDEGVVMAHGFPICGTAPDCLDVSAKVLAVVSLKQAPQNTIRAFKPAEAVPVLVNGSYMPEEYRLDMLSLIDTAAGVAQRVPIYELACLPDESAVDLLEKTLKGR